MTGKIYLIPTPISDGSIDQLSISIKEVIPLLDLFFVENQKVSRRILKAISPDISLEDIEMIEIGKYADKEDWERAFEKVWMGKNAGLMSDAGCPGVGDPGYQIVKMAHQSGVAVVPLSGPNSFIMALMSSGLNGQAFRFHGYLPIEKNSRKKKLKQLALDAAKHGESQIFMETPYRNQTLFEEIQRECPGNVLLCIAENISGLDEHILTLPISDWKKMKKTIAKVPTVFIFGS